MLPLTHFTELTRDVMVRDEHVWENADALAVVAVWGVVGLVGRAPRLPLAAAGGIALVPAANEPTIAFVVERRDQPVLEIRVNFGVFAGRQATPAEIDRLADRLLGVLASVTIVAEERHQVGRGAEASVHQVRIELAEDELPADPAGRAALGEQLLAHAEDWTRACIAERNVEPAG